MRITFGHFWPLLVLLVIPLFWGMMRRTTISLSHRHLRASVIVRTTVLVLLALALMRPVWHRAGQWISVVYALDVSSSIDPGFIDTAIDWIASSSSSGEPAHTGFIAFGGSAQNVGSVDGIRAVEVSSDGANGSIDQGATNLETAVAQALRSFDPRYLKRLVLITDGNQNVGDLTRIVGHAQESGVRIFSMPANVRGEGDSWIEAIELPQDMREQEPVATTVQIFSRVAATATVEVLGNGATLESREVNLEPGLNTIPFEVRLPAEGRVTISGRLETESDPFPQNDLHAKSIWVGSRPRILYVEGRPASAHYLRDALVGEGMEIVLGQPGSIPTTVTGLEAYDLVLLSDVPSTSLSPAQMNAILAYVRDSSGGFIFAGGESTFGEDGYAETAIEEILPIRFEINEKRKDLALVIVLDKSYSMVGPKLQLSKEAAKAALDLLEPTHRFGMISFDDTPHSTVPLQLATNKPLMTQLIHRIRASFQTNIYPALEMAFESLAESDAEARHIILLSDGKTYPDEYEALVTRMAEDDITVSSVAVGEEADRELLGNIAEWGNGRSYFMRDVARVPQIFIRETKIASQKTLIEETVETTVASRVEAFTSIDMESAPPLRGYVSTQAKENAEVLLASEASAPILARWHYGLGKAAVFTSDVKNRWATDWLTWQGYGKFWSQLVRETMRRDEGERVDFVIERVGDEAVVTVSAVTEEGVYQVGLDPRLEVVEPGGERAAVALDQIGPGTYQGRYSLETSAESPYGFHLSAEGFEDQALSLYYPYRDEYRLYPPNVALLTTISEETGGKLLAGNDEIFADYGESASVPTPLWPLLAGLALVGYLLDIAMRRAPWFWRLFEVVGSPEGG